jgi:hypothetical protein
MKRNARNTVFLLIRITLILSVLLNLLLFISGMLSNPGEDKSELFSRHSKNFELIFYALITFILSYGPSINEARQKIDLPDILEIVIVLFIYAGLFLSSRFSLYRKYFWWDDLLHTLSGVIIGFIGFIAIHKMNHKYSMDISPLLVAIFSFTFAVTLGVIWEIMEFSCDVFIGSTHQQWDLPDTEMLMGKPYQGSGLRDTMSDLIVDSIGAFVTSLITYYMYKNQKKRTMEKIQKIIHDSQDLHYML